MYRVECEICASYIDVETEKEAKEVKKEVNGICPECLTIGSLCIKDLEEIKNDLKKRYRIYEPKSGDIILVTGKEYKILKKQKINFSVLEVTCKFKLFDRSTWFGNKDIYKIMYLDD